MKKKLLLSLVVSMFLVANVYAEEGKCTCDKETCPCKCGCHSTSNITVRENLINDKVNNGVVMPVKQELINIKATGEEKVIDFEDTLSKKKDELKQTESEFKDAGIVKMQYVGGLVTRNMTEPLKDKTENAVQDVKNATQTVEDASAQKIEAAKGFTEVKIENVQHAAKTVEDESAQKIEAAKGFTEVKIENVQNAAKSDVDAVKETTVEVQKSIEVKVDQVNDAAKTGVNEVKDVKIDVQKAIELKTEEAQAAVEEASKNVSNTVMEKVVAPVEKAVETSSKMLKNTSSEVQNESFMNLFEKKTQSEESAKKSKFKLFGKKK